ncbi:MAG TPA: monooxygenase, partial [Alphaproteobacteria bacterium]|nr:monooxygenase [Alphaproteobacteria bacterium]
MSESLSAVAAKAGMKLDYDPDELKKKYLAERDKRLRADGNRQYREITGEFAHFVTDPYVEPGFTREPLFDEVDVIVIGGGFGGLLAGARPRGGGGGPPMWVGGGGAGGGR